VNFFVQGKSTHFRVILPPVIGPDAGEDGGRFLSNSPDNANRRRTT
jgi:hypothetical protein